MKFILLLFILGLGFTAKTQYNLVPNSGFEEVPNCGDSTFEIEDANFWISPTEFGTPDLLNFCNLNSLEWITTMQLPHSGNSYAGFYTGEQYTDMPLIYDAREYIQTQLLDTLEQNNFYYTTFFVSLAEFGRYATNNLGVHFSDSAIYRSGIGAEFTLLNYLPQILPFDNPVIKDTIDTTWFKVEAIYTAHGGEKFITIGNFSGDHETVFENFIPTTNIFVGAGDEAYYFIDDISITPIDSLPGGLPANAGPDQTIYIQDSVFIGQRIANLNCNWYELGGNQIASNTSGLYVQPNQTTTYVVEQILGTDISYDTCTVFVIGLGVEENLQQHLKLYPNPNNGEFTLELPKTLNDVTLQISDLSGKVVYSSFEKTAPTSLKIKSELIPGMYTIEIKNAQNNLMFREKIVVN
jgi:hypothetical protein